MTSPGYSGSDSELRDRGEGTWQDGRYGNTPQSTTPVATECLVGSGHTPVHTTELKTQTAQRGWGTDGWKPTTAEAADTFTARYTGRIGQEYKGQVTGNKRGQQPHQTTGLPRVHAHLRGDRGGDFIPATTQPTPHKSTKVVAQQQSFQMGRVLKHAWRIRWL